MKWLTYKDRQVIQFALQSNIAVVDIARQLGKNKATIYREIQRGTNPETGKYDLLYVLRQQKVKNRGHFEALIKNQQEQET